MTVPGGYGPQAKTPSSTAPGSARATAYHSWAMADIFTGFGATALCGGVQKPSST